MDKYNNLNTCNVLYNRPSQLDKTYASENINDDNRYLSRAYIRSYYFFGAYELQLLLKKPN